MSVTKNDILIGSSIFMGIGSIVTIIYSVVVTNRLHNIEEKFDKSVKDLVRDAEITIPEDLIRKAVDREVRHEASYQVEQALSKASSEVVREYKSKIETVVEDEFKLQKEDVAKTLKRKIDDIDISEIKRQVKAEAKQACIAKLKDDIDDLSDKYTEQIESMTSIYETVASKIQSIGD